MRTLISAIAVVSLCAPAFASKISVQFTPEEGDPIEVTFDNDAMVASMGDYSAPFEIIEENTKICTTNPAGEAVCVKFPQAIGGGQVGAETSYSDDRGVTGVAKITAIETD